MIHVLMIVTVMTTSTGVATNTRFQEFSSLQTCEVARDGAIRGIAAIKGTLGRDVFAECYKK